jgi:hypothetical protein
MGEFILSFNSAVIVGSKFNEFSGSLVYEKLFNLILDTGIIPESWLLGTIKPFYKNKGNKNDPKNYRPITILSCLGKLFTAILTSKYCRMLFRSLRMRSTFSFVFFFIISKRA